MVPTRRRLLSGAATAGAAALAGCAAFGTGCTHSLGLHMERSTVADAVERDARRPAEFHTYGASLVAEAIEEDTATFRAVEPPPLPSGGYLVVDDEASASGRRYVRVVVEAVAEETVTGYEFDLSMDAKTTPAADESVLAFRDLSAADRRAFLAALGFPEPRKFTEANAMSGTGTVAFAEETLVEASELVPEPAADYVRYRDRDVRLSTAGTTEATVTTYEVTLEEVATTDEAFAAVVREEHGVVLDADDLSGKQREILEEAIGGEYSECDEFSAAMTGLRDRLADANYANYEGTWYRVELRETMA